jgi:diguanylate cyclase (GGDEF)-like protein
MIKLNEFFWLTPRSAAEQPIFNELLGGLYKRIPANILASLVMGPFLAFIMSKSVSQARIGIWLVILIAAQFLAFLLAYSFNRRDDLSEAGDKKWLYLLGATVIIDGVAWGMAGPLLFTEQYPQYQMLLTLFIMAGAAAATITFSSWLGVALTYIVVVLTPGIITLIGANWENYRLLGWAGIAFGGILIALAATSNQTTTRMLRLRFDNERLVANLSESHAQMSKLNAELRKNNGALQKALEKISLMATRDELTNCHNRRYLMEFLAREKSRSDRTETVFSVAVIDLDYFKRINDSYGHLAGDDVLRQVVTLIQRHVRATDCFARFGGEEFALVYSATLLEEAQQSAERLRQEISTTAIACESFSIYTSVSIGIAEFRKDDDIADLLRRADQGLYVAKSSGRDRVIAMSRDQISKESGAIPH